MKDVIFFILICFGFTNILVNGTIFDAIRPKYKFFHCSMCVGAWVGIIVFLLFWFFGNIKLFPNIYVGSFLFACLSSGTTSFLTSLYDDFGIKISLAKNGKDIK